MPSGGKRPGAGRKPKPLADKLASGNPGHRPLTKLDFNGGGRPKPPEYLRLMKTRVEGLPTPIEIFEETINYLEPSGCLNMISPALLADYALAKYYLINAQYELSHTATVGYNEKHELMVTSFTEAMLKLQKNVVLVWDSIWDVVSRNSETAVKNPEQDMILSIISGRARKRRSKGVPEDGGYERPENPSSETEPGDV